MALTVASGMGTLSVASLAATYNATAHGANGILYIKYTKGDETGVTVTLAYKAKGMVSTDLYSHVSVNSSTRVISATSFIMTASGNYRIPISWTSEEKSMVFTFAQYGVTEATGSVSVDYREVG